MSKIFTEGTDRPGCNWHSGKTNESDASDIDETVGLAA